MFKLIRLKYLSIILTAVIFYCSCKSTSSTFSDLSATAEITEVNRAENYSVITLTLINDNDTDIPADGWSLRFNMLQMMDTTRNDGRFVLQHLNGDYYGVDFSEKFEGIPANGTSQINVYVASPITNFTDVPAGLHIVFEDESKAVVDIEEYHIIPYKVAETSRLATLLAQYDANANLNFQSVEATPRIIPLPVSAIYAEGQLYVSGNPGYEIDPVFEAAGDLLKNVLGKLSGEVPRGANTLSNVRIVQSANIQAEGYELTVGESGIVIRAADGAGVFYAIQTLSGILPLEAHLDGNGANGIPFVEIKDAPRFGYRGVMLDVTRNFRDKAQVLKIIDLMGRYKLNRLHLHLNDDEGWRIEIPSLPELTQVGSVRSTAFGDGSTIQPSYGSGTGKALKNQYYSTSDFVEILKYANDRYIQVIPEIETPGHARAAIKSMDYRYERLMKAGDEVGAREFLLRDFDDVSKYSSAQHWTDNVMNVALPSTYRFIETVIDDVRQVYKDAGLELETVHMGADELPAGAWTESPLIHRLMDSLSIRSVHDVWSYYVGNLVRILGSRNIQLAGWEELGMLHDGKKMNPNPQFARAGIQLDVWNNIVGGGAEDLTYKLANLGYDVVITSANNFYFDQAWDNTYYEPGHNWAGYINLKQSFSLLPTNYYMNITHTPKGDVLPAGFFNNKEGLTPQGKKHVVGLKGALWSEKVRTDERMEYMLLPRMMALADRAWSAEQPWESQSAQQPTQFDAAWQAFVHRLGTYELPVLDVLNDGYQYRIPALGVKVEGGVVFANTELPGFDIRYTLDGTSPTTESKQYTSPFPLDSGTELRIAVFAKSGRNSEPIVLRF